MSKCFFFILEDDGIIKVKFVFFLLLFLNK